MKIYVASSWRNLFQNDAVKELRNAGFEVYDFKNPQQGNNGFHWSEIDPDWEKWSTEEYKKALHDPIAVAGFNNDYKGMNESDVCVLVLPCGRSAHTEAGYMAGQGKPVLVWMPFEEEPELMYKLFHDCYVSLEKIIEKLKEWTTSISATA